MWVFKYLIACPAVFAVCSQKPVAQWLYRPAWHYPLVLAAAVTFGWLLTFVPPRGPFTRK